MLLVGCIKRMRFMLIGPFVCYMLLVTSECGMCL